MKLLATIATLALAATALPTPTPQGTDWEQNGCATRSYVEYLVAQEIIYLQHTNVTAGRIAAEGIFAADIVEFGDSINSLRNDTVSSCIRSNSRPDT